MKPLCFELSSFLAQTVIQSKHSWQVKELVSIQTLNSKQLSSAASFIRQFYLRE